MYAQERLQGRIHLQPDKVTITNNEISVVAIPCHHHQHQARVRARPLGEGGKDDGGRGEGGLGVHLQIAVSKMHQCSYLRNMRRFSTEIRPNRRRFLGFGTANLRCHGLWHPHFYVFSKPPKSVESFWPNWGAIYAAHPRHLSKIRALRCTHACGK